MNKIRYALIVLFSIIPYVAIAMNTKKQVHILQDKLELASFSESKKNFRIKAAQGEYVTPRSAKRTQRLSTQKLPSVALTSENLGREFSQVPQVTIRKKTPSTNNSAETLYELAIFLHREKRNSCLNLDTSIAQKIGFDASIKRGDVNETVNFLKANNGLRTSYPLAIKLYAVMVSEADELIIHPSEAAIIPVRDICGMAKSLAVFGYNEQFLEKYARMLYEDAEMRRIINGDR